MRGGAFAREQISGACGLVFAHDGQVRWKRGLARPLLLLNEFVSLKHSTKRLPDLQQIRLLLQPTCFTRSLSLYVIKFCVSLCCPTITPLTNSPHVSLPQSTAFRHNALSLTKQAKGICSSLAFHLRPTGNLIRRHSLGCHEG